MTRPAQRTITLADLLILVGTAGVGMGCLMAVDRTLLGGRLAHLDVIKRLSAGWHPGSGLIAATDVIAYTLPLLVGWSAVLPLLRLRSPRPRLRRALGQPGIVASLAAWAGAAWGFVAMLLAYGLSQTRPGGAGTPFSLWARRFLAGELLGLAGLAVAMAWLGLALAGRWRRAQDWVDRLGRVLGWGWIVVGLIWAMADYLDII